MATETEIKIGKTYVFKDEGKAGHQLVTVQEICSPEESGEEELLYRCVTSQGVVFHAFARELSEFYQNYPPLNRENADMIARMAGELCLLAEKMGMILTIERAPLTPLAMGNTFRKIRVRSKRIQDEAS